MAHEHYFKPIPPGATRIDVYRVLTMFGVTDPCIQHAVKKLLVAGGRGAGKSIDKDVQEAIDSLARWMAMRDEEGAASAGFSVYPAGVPSGCECQNYGMGPSACKGPLPGQFCRRGITAQGAAGA